MVCLRNICINTLHKRDDDDYDDDDDNNNNNKCSNIVPLVSYTLTHIISAYSKIFKIQHNPYSWQLMTFMFILIKI